MAAMSHSDDESFVILGTSPLNSLNSNSGSVEADGAGSAFGSLRESQVRNLTAAAEPSVGSEIVQNEQQDKSAEENEQTHAIAERKHTEASELGTNRADSPQKSLERSTDRENSQEKSMERSSDRENSQQKSLERSTSRPNSQQNSLQSNASSAAEKSVAASFILGEMNKEEVLRTSVYSQFPSLCSMEACADDVAKLQNLMAEHLDLKNALMKVNSTITMFHERSLKWREDTRECQRQLASLRNENMQLKHELQAKMELITISDHLREKDHLEITQSISEKTAQIGNMRAQIEKLEQQQLASFEYVPKNAQDSKQKPDYVDRLEHERTIKEFERKLSQLYAENVDLKDVQKQYIDEITCLRVNLTAAEEIIKQDRADIALLKSNDIENSLRFGEHAREREEMKEEMSLLRQQVEVFSKDFQMEREARENLAGEKDQLLQDLRQLQRKNQTLIEEAQKRMENIEIHTPPIDAPSSSSAAIIRAASASAAAYEASIQQRPIRVLPASSTVPKEPPKTSLNTCPVCYKSLPSLSYLQSHVNQCLDKMTSDYYADDLF